MPTAPGTVCPSPSDVLLWQQRYAQMNAAYVTLNGQNWLDPVSFGVAALSSSKATGMAAGASSLQQALNGAAQPIDLGVSDYLAAFAVPSYRGTNVPNYVTGYATVPDYAIDAGDAASAAVWLVDNDLLSRDQALAVVAQLYADPSVDVGDKLYIEDVEYEAGVIQ